MEQAADYLKPVLLLELAVVQVVGFLRSIELVALRADPEIIQTGHLEWADLKAVGPGLLLVDRLLALGEMKL